MAKNTYQEGTLRAGQIPTQTPTSCYNNVGDREGLVNGILSQLCFYDIRGFII